MAHRERAGGRGDRLCVWPTLPHREEKVKHAPDEWSVMLLLYLSAASLPAPLDDRRVATLGAHEEEDRHPALDLTLPSAICIIVVHNQTSL